jgi:DNA-directed RNA polymerase subunit RPC12/RpoP
MSGWSVREVRGLYVCARCGGEANGWLLAPDATDGGGEARALECGACGGCEWFHIEDERPALDAAAGGPYR